MKRIFLTAAGLLALLHSFSQTTADTTGFKSRKLKVDEINLVFSYYKQDGGNASVTGGTGTEKLTDIANVIDVKLTRFDKKLRKHSYTIEAGIDHYTSASSDMIDLKANSSASSEDNRIYGSINWNRENEAKGNNLGLGVAYSSEFDYQSLGFNVNFAKKTRNRNGEFTARLQAYLDQVSLIAPEELRTPFSGADQSGTASRKTYAGAFTYSQVVNERLQLMLLADVISQQGYLSLPFHRVYLNDASVRQEKLPDSRLKIPVGLRASYFIGDRFILRAYYRFYTDDWGLKSHTASVELPIKITPFLSVSPFYRFYDQTAIKYFAPYRQHTAADVYRTSNYDLSKFSSNFYGAGIRIAPPKGIFGLKRFNMLELRYGYYAKNINLNSNIISLNAKFR